MTIQHINIGQRKVRIIAVRVLGHHNIETWRPRVPIPGPHISFGNVPFLESKTYGAFTVECLSKDDEIELVSRTLKLTNYYR